MSVHIETIAATNTLVEALLPGAEIPGMDDPEPFSESTLILTDQDNALVIVGTADELEEVIRRAHEAVSRLRDQLNRPKGG